MLWPPDQHKGRPVFRLREGVHAALHHPRIFEGQAQLTRRRVIQAPPRFHDLAPRHAAHGAPGVAQGYRRSHAVVQGRVQLMHDEHRDGITRFRQRVYHESTIGCSSSTEMRLRASWAVGSVRATRPEILKVVEMEVPA